MTFGLSIGETGHHYQHARIMPNRCTHCWRDGDERMSSQPDVPRKLVDFGVNAQKPYWTITTEMVRRNNVGPIHAGNPDILRRGFTESRQHIGEPTDDSASESNCRFKREIEDRDGGGSELDVRRGLTPRRRNQDGTAGDDHDENHAWEESHVQPFRSFTMNIPHKYHAAAYELNERPTV